jgi:HJR/Mrr/RecB family endonuclease
MIPMTLEIFLPCYFNSQLAAASSKFSTALFHANWTNGRKKLQSSAKIFAENTKKEMKLMAFCEFELNLTSFLKIINSAYTLFAVLKNINN